VITASMS